MNKLPSKIIVSKTVSYDVEPIIKDIKEWQQIPIDKIDIDKVMEYVNELISEDFGGDPMGVIQVTDENGKPIDNS